MHGLTMLFHGSKHHMIFSVDILLLAALEKGTERGVTCH